MQHSELSKALTKLVNIGNIYSVKNRKDRWKMDINIARLKETVVTRNTTMEALAYELGISRTTLYRRLRKGSAGLSLKDARLISHALSLSRAEEMGIFGGCHGVRM